MTWWRIGELKVVGLLVVGLRSLLLVSRTYLLDFRSFSLALRALLLSSPLSHKLCCAGNAVTPMVPKRGRRDLRFGSWCCGSTEGEILQVDHWTYFLHAIPWISWENVETETRLEDLKHDVLLEIRLTTVQLDPTSSHGVTGEEILLELLKGTSNEMSFFPYARGMAWRRSNLSRVDVLSGSSFASFPRSSSAVS